MKIIDAHIHFKDKPDFNALAKQAGHENTLPHLESVFEKMNIKAAVIMSNDIPSEVPEYPPFLSYCAAFLTRGPDGRPISPKAASDAVIEALGKPQCVGVKLYPGYEKRYVSDSIFHEVFDAAAAFGKPVAIHTGATAGSHSYLKYCHPLTVDEAAADFPKTTFVMCHYGNPWVMDAAAVMDKNPNVCADLSGILEASMGDSRRFCRENQGYADYLRTWIKYPCDPLRLMYGTDWPLINMMRYAEFIASIVPEKWWDDVFFGNANRIYSLGL